MKVNEKAKLPKQNKTLVLFTHIYATNELGSLLTYPTWGAAIPLCEGDKVWSLFPNELLTEDTLPEETPYNKKVLVLMKLWKKSHKLASDKENNELLAIHLNPLSTKNYFPLKNEISREYLVSFISTFHISYNLHANKSTLQ